MLLTLKYAFTKMGDATAKMPLYNSVAPKNVVSPAPVPIIANNYSDLIGKWSISQVLTSSNVARNSEFVVTNNTIILSLNCSTVILGYSLTSPSPIKIKI